SRLGRVSTLVRQTAKSVFRDIAWLVSIDGSARQPIGSLPLNPRSAYQSLSDAHKRQTIKQKHLDSVIRSTSLIPSSFCASTQKSQVNANALLIRPSVVVS
ncbi:MAG TPA: hypothetical protein VFR80_11790, partial [Pyrinomonadaceae bacterium]|nr:hypothetical protein [Pyrinomonadaceae bacterium]